MGSEYVLPAEYPYYGMPVGTTPQQVRAASTLVDSYLNRPEGVIWLPDSFGRPAFMAGLLPPTDSSTLGLPQLASPIEPGRAVIIPYMFATYDLIGEVFVLDRADPDLCEIVTVIGVNQDLGTITLAQVNRGHAAGALLEAGLCIVEDRALPAKRPIARVSRPNLTAVLSAAGRYGYGRRSDAMTGYPGGLAMLATLQSLGGAQTWQPIDPTGVSISSVTGECWITPGLTLAYFSEVRLRYVAGFAATAVPPAIKQATANIMANQASAIDVSPVFKVYQAGGTKMERFSDVQVDGDTKSLLDSYKTRVMV